jgi:hypothetical protein
MALTKVIHSIEDQVCGSVHRIDRINQYNLHIRPSTIDLSEGV